MRHYQPQTERKEDLEGEVDEAVDWEVEEKEEVVMVMVEDWE